VHKVDAWFEMSCIEAHALRTVFDGCRHASKPVVEKATVSSPSTSSDTNVLSIYRATGWLVTIWVSVVSFL
jgi:hypothetical protein